MSRRMPGGGVITTPLTIAPGAVKLWLRADKGASITSSVNWNDQSGTGDANKNCSQANVTGWALGADSGFNGRQVFTVGTKALHSAGWAASIAAPFTVFICGSYDGTNTNELYLDDHNGTSRNIVDENGSALGRTSFFSGAYQGVARTANTSAKVVAALFNGDANSQLFHNSTTAGVTGNVGANNFVGTSIGGSNADTAILVGKVAEVVVCSSITAAQRNAMINYLGARYAVTIS